MADAKDVLEVARDGSFDVSDALSSARTSKKQQAEHFRQKGNDAFRDRAFERAETFYSQAVERDCDNHLLYSNRSAARHQLKRFAPALEDAQKAIDLAPKWAKGYLRKAHACEGLRQWGSAIDAYKTAISLEAAAQPSTDTKRAAVRIKQLEAQLQCEQRAPRAVQKGFFTGQTTSIYAEKEDVVKQIVDPINGEARLEDPKERSWRFMLRRLKDGCSNANNAQAVLNGDGVFAKLLQEAEFQKLVYPGIPKAQLVHVPQNLQVLLEDPWYEDELLALMPKVEAKAQSVLENVKKRGAAQGEIMDPATEATLRPQVLQEAFGREVLAMVHRVNTKKHALLANDARTLADPQSELAMWDQLTSECLDDLLRSDRNDPDSGKVAGAAVVDAFMGDEWTQLLLDDVQRMARNDLLMDVAGDAALAGSMIATGASKEEHGGRLRFVEPSECEQEYPAVAELLEKLHALPYEINRKRPAQAQLCAQFAHCTCITQLRQGERQRLRLDCGKGDKDNGFKITCVYFFNGSGGSNGPRMQLRTDLGAQDDAGAQQITPRADRLVLFQSQRVFNEITTVPGDELFFLTFWIHGKELR
uniref:Uncharacterized protein n=1 Tax=Globisporangium ultimum (strain ATCC 200006 / CBS 805.95 / DAOM BR144) TaxID=431595 RepID=K3X0D3_GLOUD